MNFDLNFTDEGKNILKKTHSNERMINYNNLIFKTGNLIIKNFDFLKRFGTLYDLLTDLLSEEISTLEAAKEREEMKENINELGNFVLLEKKSIKKNKTEVNIKKGKNMKWRNQILGSQKNVLKNAVKLYDKRDFISNAFVNNHVYHGDVEKDVYYMSEKSEPKFEESIVERSKLRRQRRPKYTVD